MITINFKTKSMKEDGRYLIKDGVASIPIRDAPVTVDELNTLYREYKSSQPSEGSSKFRHPYFRALSPNEMTDEELLLGQDRQTAKEALETAVLMGALNGSLRSLFATDRQWFWQSDEDNDFVILRSWIF